jgi:outer membrane receptor protein involved in Fe transport
MTNKILATLLLIAVSVSSAFAARNNNNITGKVTEKGNGNPLPFATVTVQATDNKVIGGATTADNGTFTINNLPSSNFKLRVSFIGFKDTVITVAIKPGENTFNAGTIEMKAETTNLKAAVVTARVPVIEQKLDKIVMNVAEAVSTQGTSGLDVLRKAPGISIDPSGNILLNGQPAQIWIDNRPSNLSGQDLEAMLSGTDGASIDKIEIISNPSSKYDASGSGGIINIKTKKLFLKGINGSVRVGYDGANYDKYYNGANGTINMNYRGEKTNTFVNYSPRYSEDFGTFYSETKYGNNLLTANTKTESYSRAHSYKIGQDYYLNKKNIFGFIINGMSRSVNDASDPETGSTLFVSGVANEFTKTRMDNGRNNNSISPNVNYTHIFSEGHELTANFDYSYFDLNNTSEQENIYTNAIGQFTRPDVLFRTNSQQYIDIISAKVDYERILWKSVKFEAGAKYAVSNTNNDLLREDFLNSQWTKNNSMSSKFKYKEQVTAAYLSFARQFGKKWSGKAGLRGEYTDASGEWISANTTSNRGYLDLFPTLFTGFTPNKNLRFGLSYTLRIQRPNYFQLNPFRMYIDANSSLEGNPALDPQYTHQLSLSAGYKSFLNVSLVYQLSEGAIIQNPYFNTTTGEKLLKWENFGEQTFAGVALGITEFPIKKWLILNINGFIANLNNKAGSFKSSNIFANANVNLAFLLPKNTRFEASGFAMTGIPYGYFKVEPSGNLSLSLKKGLLDNKATIAINANDILRTQRTKASNNNIDGYFFENFNKTQTISISFNYRFGQGKASKQRKVGEQEESSRVGN